MRLENAKQKIANVTTWMPISPTWELMAIWTSGMPLRSPNVPPEFT